MSADRAGQHRVVAPAEAGLRLEQLVQSWIPGATRGGVRRLIADRLVRVSGRPRAKGYRVSAGETVQLELDATSERPIPTPDLPLEVLAMDEDLVAIQKPEGLACHPLQPGETGTVANAIAARFPECVAASPQPREAGLVNRLDLATTGLLIAARTRAAHVRLRQAFGSGGVEKRYLALAAGAVPQAGAIETCQRTARAQRARVEVVPEGTPGSVQWAESSYRTLERQGELSLVELRTRSGRRHQVRVQLAHLGHPLAGDALYGGPELAGTSGAFLHAAAALLLDVGRELVAPLPAQRRDLLDELGFTAHRE